MVLRDLPARIQTLLDEAPDKCGHASDEQRREIADIELELFKLKLWFCGEVVKPQAPKRKAYGARNPERDLQLVQCLLDDASNYFRSNKGTLKFHISNEFCRRMMRGNEGESAVRVHLRRLLKSHPRPYFWSDTFARPMAARRLNPTEDLVRQISFLMAEARQELGAHKFKE